MSVIKGIDYTSIELYQKEQRVDSQIFEYYVEKLTVLITAWQWLKIYWFSYDNNKRSLYMNRHTRIG